MDFLDDYDSEDDDIVDNFEIVCQNGLALASVPIQYRNHQICRAAISQNGNALEYVADELREDPKIVFCAVRQQWTALEFASIVLRNNHEFMTQMVTYNGLTLKYAPYECRNDPNFVIIAVKQNRHALRYASLELRNNRDFMTTMIQHDGCSLEYANCDIQKDYDITRIAIQQNGIAIMYASTVLLRDHELRLLAVQQNGYALQHIPEHLQDLDIVITAVQQQGEALQFALKNYRKDYEIVFIAVQQNGMAIRYASSELFENCNILLTAVRQNINVLKKFNFIVRQYPDFENVLNSHIALEKTQAPVITIQSIENNIITYSNMAGNQDIFTITDDNNTWNHFAQYVSLKFTNSNYILLSYGDIVISPWYQAMQIV